MTARPTEVDWQRYAEALEQELAELTIQARRLAATIDTLNGYVVDLEGQLATDEETEQ